ncbi:LANO_0D03048g1_1 [Lachancea nothofagi CBS 11611]|uniref:LANO_0D03048g1_1 n=1 Tax=Lachancea nothofagi CBS 11611 TaxID=1266666 RepID=A0A1G4JES3_9SACH|nr:LANO_0D03048g1_1 [Lachancea nothofagi CBS 11611]
MPQDVSLVEPAKVRTLLVPIGKWTRSDFTDKVTALQERSEARLVDITPLNDTNFNPQGFPQGRILFEFHTRQFNEEQTLFLHDFELYRKTFVVIGLVKKEDQKPQSVLELLQKKYPDSISHNLVYFNTEISQLKNVYCASSSNLETIVCDIGRNFLEALGLYYASYKHVTLRSPGAIGGTAISKTSLMRQPQVASTSSVSTRVISNPLDTTANSTVKRSASLKSLGLNSVSSDQHRAKARQCKILGNFKLLAGRYVDALNSFAEAATTLHKYHDNIWLGSALEGLVISMLLLSYLRVPFQVPVIISIICPVKDFEQSSNMSNVQRNSTSSGSFQSPRNSLSSVSSRINIIESQNVAMPLLIKSVSERVLHYYELSLSHNTEYAPQIVYCEHILRVARFMSYCHSHSQLDKDLLKSVYTDENPTSLEAPPSSTSLSQYFSKCEICQFVNKLFELQLKEMDVISQIRVYISLGLIYRDLGFQRKQAFVSRILLVSLLPRHISDNIFDMLDDSHHDTLNSLLEAYGIYKQPEILIEHAANCTWVTLQKNILMLAINMASKNGNKQKVCEYSLTLLQKYSHVLTQNEQKILLENNILSFTQGIPDLVYWDPFLLRKLRITQLENHKSIPQEKLLETDEVEEHAQRHLEVFNPFKENGVHGVTEKMKTCKIVPSFLLGETAELVLTFQNPFKFDLNVTHLSFEAADDMIVNFLSNSAKRELPFKVSANSLASIHVPVTFTKETHGKQTIKSLVVGVFGLKPTSFDIVMSEKTKGENESDTQRAKLESFEFRVINEQPHMEFVSSSFNDNSCMMLEGTKETFQIVLRNQSLSQPANYLQFTHKTNVESNLNPDYWKKLGPDDLYDIETQLKWMQRKCIVIRDKPQEIPANSSVELTVEIDVTQASFDFKSFEISLEYGHKMEKNSTSVYTKTLVMPFNVTLKRSLEAPNLEVVPLTEELKECENSVIRGVDKVAVLDPNDLALLLLDIRNSWDANATLRVHFNEFSIEPETLNSHSTKRFVIPIKKNLQSSDWGSKEIPKLVSGRQFVSSGMTRDEITTMRHKFWCREMLLESLKCEWRFQDSRAVRGSINFRQYLDMIDTRTVDILCQRREAPYHVNVFASKPTLPLGDTLRLSAQLLANKQHPAYTEDLVQIEFLLYNRRTGLALAKSNTRLLYNGQLTFLVNPKNSSPVELEITAIDAGEYEVGCCINSSYFSDTPVYFRVLRPVV